MKKILLIAIMAIFTTGAFAAEEKRHMEKESETTISAQSLNRNNELKIITKGEVTKLIINSKKKNLIFDDGGFPIKLSCGITVEMPRDMVTLNMMGAYAMAVEWLFCHGGLMLLVL